MQKRAAHRLPLKTTCGLVLSAVFVLVLPAAARAQADAAVALGLSFSRVTPTNDNADSSSGPGLLLRLRGNGTVGPAIGFGWFSSDVHATIGGERTYLGKVNVKPVLVGASYTRHLPRVEASVELVAGYAFTNARATGLAKQAYRDRLGATNVSIHVSDAFAWRTGISVWFELGRNYGLLASLSYLGVNPAVTTTSSLGSSRSTVNLGSVVSTVGVTYAVF